MSPACPVCNSTHNTAGVEIREIYDGVSFWTCLRCGHLWNRWPPEHDRHTVTELYIKQWRAEAAT